MTTLDFLKSVWPTQGIYLVAMPISGTDKATGQPWKSYKHFAYHTVEDAVKQCEILTASGVDCYFALGSVKEDLTHTNKAQRDALGKKVRGVHKKSGFDTTLALRSLWMDLDVKPDPLKAYLTFEDAFAALKQFCIEMKLPTPTIVRSGGGLHAYWPMDADVDPERWQHYANILKQLTISWKLKADPSRTADRASILRPAGTYNFKQAGNPRPVEILFARPAPIPVDTLFKRLAYLADTIDLPPLQQRTASVVNMLPGTPPVAAAIPGLIPVVQIDQMAAAAMNGAGYATPDSKKVILKCQQLMAQANYPADVSEPSWYAMIGCLRHTDRPDYAIHFLSRRHPDYNEDLTNLKIQQSTDAGYPPTTCQKFEIENPGGCNGCPYRGKIKTPLSVVRELEEAPPPVVTPQPSAPTQTMVAAPAPAVQVLNQQLSLPPPPAPYKRVLNPVTGLAQIAITESNEDGDIDVVIYGNDLFPKRIIFDERTNSYVVVMSSYLPQDGWSETEIPMGMLYDKRKLAVLFGNAGIMPDLRNIDNVVQYMIAYIRSLQSQAKSTMIYAQLGWRPELDEFILPDKVVGANGTRDANVSKNVVNALQWQKPVGTLEQWKQIVAAYDKPHMEAHQFGFGVAFGSPLLRFTNLSGLIVSMVGRPGAGKTSSALSANSVWGHPKMGWADMEHDTMRAFYNKLGVLKNLPATYDEHTNLDPQLVSDMCYMVSKGQGRQRLTGEGLAAEQHNSWQLMMVMTGNTSLNSRLGMAKADSSAEAARIFEYKVPQNTMPKADADALWGVNGAIFNNYGLAGEVYATHLMQNLEHAKQRVGHWVRVIDQRGAVTSAERFWSAGAACILAGFELANDCGLTNCDVNRLLEFVVAQIHLMRGTVEENTKSPASLLAEFFNKFTGATLVLAAPTGPNVPPRFIQEPAASAGLKIRIERETNTAYIDRAAFYKFCQQSQVDKRAVAEELMILGVMGKHAVRKLISKGWSGESAQNWVFSIDLNHPELSGKPILTSAPTGQPVFQLPPVTGHLSVVP